MEKCSQTLAAALISLSSEHKTLQESVIQEITTYFKNVLNSPEFGSWLTTKVKNNTQSLTTRTQKITVYSNMYNSRGSCMTYFAIGIFRMEPNEGCCTDRSLMYRGVYLPDIQNEVGRRLVLLLEAWLRAQGLDFEEKPQPSNNGNFENIVVVKW